MAKIWPQDKIRELLAEADLVGSARAKLASADDAKLFRFAIYGFRRQNDLGQDIEITLDGEDVVLTKRNTPVVSIVGQD